jgi:hypothetical protein
MMSNIQVLYLQYRITKKLCQDGDCLRKLVAHQNLHTRLPALAADADGELSRSRKVLDQTLEEARNLLKVGQYERMRAFEDRISMRFDIKRFADLSLEDLETKRERIFRLDH